MDFKNKIEKYSIRKFKIGVGSALIGFTLLGAVGLLDQLPVVGDVFNVQSVSADEAVPKPEGNVIARGEDGVPWELYQNGYLLFKPVAGKDTLTGSKRVNGIEQSLTWKKEHGRFIKFIGFSGKVYLPEDSSNLFNEPSNSSGSIRGQDGSYSFEPVYLDSSKLDSSKVKKMSSMFEHSTFESLDLSNWDVSNVTNMNSIFYKSGIKNLNISNWNTSNVKDMYHMFAYSDFANLNIKNWNVSNVTNMYEMFYYSNLEELDLSNWNTSNVKSMSSIFGGMKKLVKLNVSNFDLSKVDDIGDLISSMFLGDGKLKEITIGSNFKSTDSSINSFLMLDEHKYGDQYTSKWVKQDGSSGPFTIDEWHSEYLKNSSKLEGTWVREIRQDEALTTAKTDAINAIKAEADKKNKEIDSANLLPEDVTKLKQQVEAEKNKGIDNVNKATDQASVTSKKDEAIKAIQGISLTEALKNKKDTDAAEADRLAKEKADKEKAEAEKALATAKTDAINAIKAEADKKNKEIDSANLLPEDVTKLKQQVEAEKNKGIDNVNKATDQASVTSKKDEAIKAIQGIVISKSGESLVNDTSDYNGTLTSNDVDENGNQIKPLINDKSDYKGPLASNGVDENGNEVKPLVNEKPEFDVSTLKTPDLGTGLNDFGPKKDVKKDDLQFIPVNEEKPSNDFKRSEKPGSEKPVNELPNTAGGNNMAINALGALTLASVLGFAVTKRKSEE